MYNFFKNLFKLRAADFIKNKKLYYQITMYDVYMNTIRNHNLD